jgi:effector-binding domain-containing protein
MKYNVNKSVVIDANIDTVRPYIADFNKWNSWSPWTIIDPKCKNTITGDAGKVGAKMHWSGEIIGEGEMYIESIEGDNINHDLKFLKPFKSSAKSGFIIEKMGEDKTKVTWTMDSSLPFFLFFMVKTMKNWIGMDYERGLTMLKEMAEKGKVEAKTINKGVVPLQGFSYVGIKKTSAFADMPKEMSAIFEKMMGDLQSEGKQAQKWICIYPKVNMKTMMFTYICAVSDEQLKGEDMGSDYVTGEIKTGNALEISHKGSYRFLGNAWSMGMMYMRAKKLKNAGNPFEFYHNNPQEVEENEIMTSIYFPTK